MFKEEDLLPISALQHLLFCERRVALVYIEGIWDENLFTVEGHHTHSKVHDSESESRGTIRIARGLLLRSLRLGLTGKADVVEFHLVSDSTKGTKLEGVPGLWQPLLVEYKRGRLRHEREYEVQLCAQAICLEEMLGVSIPSGAIFYGKTGRRLKIEFDETLRSETETAAARLHEIFQEGKTPKARYVKKCKKCSLLPHCMPKVTGVRHSVDWYLSKAITNLDEEQE